MLASLLIFSYLAQLVQGTSTSVTDFSCPPADGTTRSVWSILGSCALTLLICVWHTIHFDLPDRQISWYQKPVGFVLTAFLAPEVVVALASKEWVEARKMVNEFRDKGYEWSMTHSFFMAMEGFICRDKYGDRDLSNASAFLQLCTGKENRIINPDVTVADIKEKSKSDLIGKVILALQLLWFMLQVVVQGSRGLAITLVELDTVCMAVLSLLIIFLWWDKPLRPERPHIFYLSPPEAVLPPRTKSDLSKAWKSERTHLSRFMDSSTAGDEETTELLSHPKRSKWLDNTDKVDVWCVSFCGAWMVLGAMHLIAWDFNFPTESEKIIWRVASLVLAGGSPAFCAIWLIALIGVFVAILGLVSRALLVGLMLASLRRLPCSAYQSVSWTNYIPHL